VGLGKTIEAGLVIQELFLRHRARTAVIVRPPSLALKWQDEMREKFGLDFTIVNSELMAQVPVTAGYRARAGRPATSGSTQRTQAAARRSRNLSLCGRRSL